MFGPISMDIPLTPVVQLPVGGHFYDVAVPPFCEWLHPVLRVLGYVRLDPSICLVGQVVQLAVVVHERVVVFDAKLLEKLDGLLGSRPGGRCPSPRPLSREGGQHLDRLLQDVALLDFRECVDELVGVTVKPAKESELLT
jgi:hypothetical protein